ncbi:MAG: DUF5522 domain-containing protein [Chloracidobacterium sp.]|uniref:Uncharacterized protein n=1 Tax=Chloracidobacterium validum TaxID=2821543 RepID=A0ABX8BDR2_9BACT|nr:DUF5522 domain-containing protein [Chloracidobacterium validum]QUW03210.1 hypothetical protein J8C06_01860 [Chloracidobacterium validum]
MALLEGRDYYIEQGRYVFTAHYLLVRGQCCGSGCRHCPYHHPTDNQLLPKRLQPEPAQDAVNWVSRQVAK